MGIKDMELNKRYIIDLSQAQTPADIVFELSSIIEKPEAANQTIWLKLGDVALNQSQLLSINSLINSINSSIVLIETPAQQTNQTAEALGISTSNIEEKLQEELSELETNTIQDAPSEQYVQMTEHLEDNVALTVEEEKEASEDIENEEAVRNLEAVFDEEDGINDTKTENVQESVYTAEPMTEEKEEEIQNQLDSIFDSEAKLENILSGEKELYEMRNWPLTKEAEDEFEIPEEVMTDEDYAILKMDTQYHKQTVRSGQVIKSNRNVVIIGDCHPGCEIHAAGDITVWGILGGIAHAGCNGNTKARIRALTLNAIQLRIADSFARRPDHIKNIYVEKSNTFTPEEARNINGSIVILKVND